jgi:RNA recognition motif-containing protein
MRPEKIQGNIFVANLPVGLSDEQLAELFDPYGMVLRAYLARDPGTGETRGHGLVQLAPDRAVDQAIAGVNGTVLQGRAVDVRRADPDMSLVPSARPKARVERPRPSFGPEVAAERPSLRSRAASAMAGTRLTLAAAGRGSWA